MIPSDLNHARMRLFTPLLVLLLAAPVMGQPLATVLAPMAVSGMAAMTSDEGDPIVLSVYPNPVMEVANVRFTIERSQQVTLDVFDLLGRRVITRDLGGVSTGEHEVALEVSDLAPGLYMVRLTGDAGARATVRMTRAVSM